MSTPIKLLYFAALRELTGSVGESVVLPGEVQRVRDLARWLEHERPVLAGRLSTVRFAIDESFAAPDDPVPAGATVALIPPVAGG